MTIYHSFCRCVIFSVTFQSFILLALFAFLVFEIWILASAQRGGAVVDDDNNNNNNKGSKL